ncbi:serine protease gd [Drosophila takahashii]|uniref:serine protease gd n=1 Tax=Drosophila takahashii TaxID=29030 RepID=UPI0007E83F75|nr:serine protease gd isoform X1 [Drosophila takahashii]XP_044252117.1 serine protease gd isoform X1 [Drosophila takahashii]
MRLPLTALCICILILCIELVSKAVAQGMPVSPCPKIFQYRFDGSEWFGLMAVRSPDGHQPLHIRVTLSMRGKPTTNYLGEIELLTRGKFAHNAPVLYKIRFPKHHFPPKLLLLSANNHVICFGSGEHSIFMTQIQLEHIRKLAFIPDKISSLLLDPHEQGEGEEADTKAEEEAKKTHIQFKKKPFVQALKDICGRIDRDLDFRLSQKRDQEGEQEQESEPILGSEAITSPVFVEDNDGEDAHGLEHFVDETEEEENESLDDSASLPSITRGSWPWLAAIYVNNLTSLDFQCGGTLVSGRVVISSAHCFKLFNKRFTSNEVLVFLGRHNLKNWNEEGSLAAPVDGIYIHPDFNSQLSSYDADIAVIMLKDEVRFNTFIRPACLWSGSSKAEYIVGEQGIVIGWSFDRANRTQDQKLSPVALGGKKSSDSHSAPKVVKAPVVGNAECFRANAHFRSLSSNRTFCAGIHTEERDRHQQISASIYTGISGAGLFIRRNNRWMLRGTVSAALPAVESPEPGYVCCRSQYIIYADVAKFLDWITAFVI